MLADIASGEVDTADVFFLIAVILFVAAAITVFIRESRYPLYSAFVATGLASMALALLVL